MPRRDLFHEAVKNALIKEGWTITHDPYLIRYGKHKLQVDLGADMPIAAERAGRKIAVEIKTFAGLSSIVDLYMAPGQYLVYHSVMAKTEPDRTLFLAMPIDAYDELLDPAHGRDLREERNVRVLVYDPKREVTVRWIE